MKKSTIILLLLLLAALAVATMPEPREYAVNMVKTVRKANTKSMDTTSGAVAAIASGVVDSTSWADTVVAWAEKAIDTAKEVVTNSYGYVNYDAKQVQEALAADKKVVLFFHASRCPTCKSLDGNILANTAAIPSDVVVFKTDYDTSTALKAKYGVTAQHTLIYLDKDLNATNKIMGAPGLKEILDGIK